MLFFLFYYLIGFFFVTAEEANNTYEFDYSLLEPVAQKVRENTAPQPRTIAAPREIAMPQTSPRKRIKTNEEIVMEVLGLKNIKDIASNVVVDLAYSKSNNILTTQLYNHNEAYLQPDAALKLAVAQKNVKDISPYLSLVIHDAARPQSIQQQCWSIAQLKGLQHMFIDPCASISMHSYGVAVDVSILNTATGQELDMGSAVDSPLLAAPKHEDEMLEKGLLSQTQYNNRQLLRAIMINAGFTPISNEWWHFEACSREEAQRRYMPIP